MGGIDEWGDRLARQSNVKSYLILQNLSLFRPRTKQVVYYHTNTFMHC